MKKLLLYLSLATPAFANTELENFKKDIQKFKLEMEEFENSGVNELLEEFEKDIEMYKLENGLLISAGYDKCIQENNKNYRTEKKECNKDKSCEKRAHDDKKQGREDCKTIHREKQIRKAITRS
jgi:hypothetical protein